MAAAVCLMQLLLDELFTNIIIHSIKDVVPFSKPSE
jgi:anti-sigma regulatory factor (Ser/Thr protein kinase)